MARKLVAMRLTYQAILDIEALQAALQAKTPGKVSQADAVAYAVARTRAELEPEMEMGGDSGGSKVGSTALTSAERLSPPRSNDASFPAPSERTILKPVVTMVDPGSSRDPNVAAAIETARRHAAESAEACKRASDQATADRLARESSTAEAHAGVLRMFANAPKAASKAEVEKLRELSPTKRTKLLQRSSGKG